MIEFRMFILLGTSPLLELITRDLEDVPWWTFRSLSQLNRRIKTSSFVFVLLSELTSLERERETRQKKRRSETIQYLMKNKFLTVQLSHLHYLVQSRTFLQGGNCFSLCIWSQNQQVQESQMQENKTLSLVLPENWHFLRGDIKGFQVQII